VNTLDIANAAYAEHIKPSFDRMIDALKQMRSANDPDTGAVLCIEALDALAKDCAAMRDELREGVRQSCDESGTVSFEAGPYLVTRTRPDPAATVTDEVALRAALPSLFSPQPDKLNRPELTKRLRRGETIPGATLGAAPVGTIQIRTRK